jgi:hypothetical protein
MKTPDLSKLDLSAVDAAGATLRLEDYRVEALLSLGGRLSANGFALPQPTLGSLPLFEAVESPIVQGFQDAKPEDLAIATTILLLQDKAVGPVLDFVLSGDRDALARAAWSYLAASEIGPDQVLAAAPTMRKYGEYIFNGFAMIPSAPGAGHSKNSMLFDSEWIARTIVRMRAATGAAEREILWEMPLSLAGFVIAVLAADAGKTISRPIDIKAATAEALRQLRAKDAGKPAKKEA